MVLSQGTLEFSTSPKSFLDITKEVQNFVSESNIQDGVCNLFIKHTSASLVIQENYDPSVRKDFETIFSKLAPEDFPYVHNMEGKDDMPAHIRSALTSTSETIPIVNEKLSLGNWQGIYIWEHRDQTHNRKVMVSMIGE
ncbi:secondary thiamine-phosphate synthase enzyme YjbQ [Marine Group III euryarchaeote]|nr:secondary thiamine-phosphate synthase enzyme YjbQ [Marine Group III euryarchaeote]MDC0197107.1 secondary thiamine-phosphate synthase enzyme YjbQ [Marine Group III euryarchaeote]